MTDSPSLLDGESFDNLYTRAQKPFVAFVPQLPFPSVGHTRELECQPLYRGIVELTEGPDIGNGTTPLDAALEIVYSAPVFDSVDATELQNALGNTHIALVATPDEWAVPDLYLTSDPAFVAGQPFTSANFPVDIDDKVPLVTESPGSVDRYCLEEFRDTGAIFLGRDGKNHHLTWKECEGAFNASDP